MDTNVKEVGIIAQVRYGFERIFFTYRTLSIRHHYSIDDELLSSVVLRGFYYFPLQVIQRQRLHFSSLL